MNLGQVCMTSGIAAETQDNPEFSMEVAIAFQRYLSGDWGDMCEEDKNMNDAAVDTEERVLAAYNTSVRKIYIITEWDRSVTTILFADEY